MPDILLEHKLVFMHNPKCASRNLRSIALQLVSQHPCTYIASRNNNELLLFKKNQQYRIQENVFREPVPKSLDYTDDHCSILGVHQLLTRFNIDSRDFRFLYTLRHPQERLVSGYRYDLKRNSISPSTSFSDYIFHNDKIKGAMPLNFYPLDKFAENAQGELQIDYLIKVDNFEEQMREVLSALNLQPENIEFNSWRNTASDFNLSQEFTYSTEELEFISTLWKKDFAAGGYTLQRTASM